MGIALLFTAKKSCDDLIMPRIVPADVGTYKGPSANLPHSSSACPPKDSENSTEATLRLYSQRKGTKGTKVKSETEKQIT
jgi:hypothetical protein